MRLISFALLLVLLGLLSRGESIHRHYDAATHLFDGAQDRAHITNPHRIQKVDQKIEQIVELSKALQVEEEKMYAMIRERETVKKNDFLWFFHNQVRLEVSEHQLEINKQERQVLDLLDEINFHWKELKPEYGVYSKMFYSELLFSFLSPFLSLFRYFLEFFEFTLISFLFFGPIVFGFFSLFTAIGSSLFPLFLSFYSFLWVARLPFLMVQYQPEKRDFFLIYSCALLVVFSLNWLASFLRRERGVTPVAVRERVTVARVQETPRVSQEQKKKK